MSGAVAAHAAYNGSGTQGLAVTNKIGGNDGDVMSVFWNKNDTTRQLLHGSSIIEIPTSGNGNSTSTSQIFAVNNDIDAIGDLYLQITSTANNVGRKPIVLVTDYIRRIEFQVGTQIWQTLETYDILALASTEMSPASYEHFSFNTSGGVLTSGVLAAIPYTSGITAGTTTTNYMGLVKIPCLSRTIGASLKKFSDATEQAYLLAGAPHQAVKIKVTLVSSTTQTATLKLFGQHIIMCNEERDQIKNMPMGLPKRIKMTQNVTLAGLSGSSSTEVNLDSFSLYASHFVIQLFETVSTINLSTVELKLNSSSYSGEIQGTMLTGSVADSMGLYFNQFYLSGNNVGSHLYIFPLASSAYGGSSVPLNRFDNIRLLLNFSAGFTGSVYVTCVGETTALYKGGAASLAMY